MCKILTYALRTKLVKHPKIKTIFEDFLTKLEKNKNLVLERKRNRIIFTEQKVHDIIQSLCDVITSYSKFYENMNFDKIEDHFQQELTELQYIMASFTDETFLSIEWEGKSYWEKNLIEEKIFHSHVSGNEIFTKIENILHEKVYKSSELIQVYLQILSLGYRGKYSTLKNLNDKLNDYEELISNYKKNLFYKAYNDKNINQDKFFPNAYYYTIQNFDNSKVNKKSIATYIIISLSTLYITISFALWKLNTAELNRSLDQLITTILTKEVK